MYNTVYMISNSLYESSLGLLSEETASNREVLKRDLKGTYILMAAHHVCLSKLPR
jgi:hypothetical protein